MKNIFVLFYAFISICWIKFILMKDVDPRFLCINEIPHVQTSYRNYNKDNFKKRIVMKVWQLLVKVYAEKLEECMSSFAKKKLPIGHWNVRTSSKRQKCTSYQSNTAVWDRYLCVSEYRWTGSGKMKPSTGHTLLYADQNTNHNNWVAMIINKEATNILLSR